MIAQAEVYRLDAQASSNDRIIAIDESAHTRVIVIGSGPVGMRVAHEILRQIPDAALSLFGHEPCQPYNRVQLSALLAGEISKEEVLLNQPVPSATQFYEFKVRSICQIDRFNKVVTDTLGDTYSYDHLVIATGSKPFIPDILGKELTGVLSFRTLADTEKLYTRMASARSVVIVGGGLLGLEAARGLLQFGTKVTLIQQGEFLMNKQLDEASADMLKHKVEALGIDVITNEGVRQIVGGSHVVAVRTRSGSLIDCDTVLFCTGISPNTQLAREAGLRITRGIVVDNAMRTSDFSIFAVGECAEHNHQTYGLVNPGFEQAAVAVAAIKGDDKTYMGSSMTTSLKVVGENVCSLGDVHNVVRRAKQKAWVHENKVEGYYRKLIINKGHIIGAVCIGPWPDFKRIQHIFNQQGRIPYYQLLRFTLTGQLFADESSSKNWPNTMMICDCQQVNKQSIVEAIDAGAHSLEAVKAQTSASSVCGGCQPMIESLLGEKKTKAYAANIYALVGVIALVLLSLFVSLPSASTSQSVLSQGWFEAIWNDHLFKQVSGFTLLGLSALSLLMSLRKRLNIQFLGEYKQLRVLHVALTFICAAVLFFHTGMHLGENLNQWLMIDFLSILSLGAMTSVIIACAHKMPEKASNQAKKLMGWLHLLCTWPLPLLISFHILSVYYF